VRRHWAFGHGAFGHGALRHWALRHGAFGLLLTVGLLLRIAAQLAYQPGLLYIDSKKYLFGTEVQSWGAFDPLGYLLLVLRPVLAFGNLAAVALLQHALGIAMAVALYLLLLRLGVSRWLAALATAPVLLDGYQLVAEQTIMPDTLFEALVAAGLVILLWRPRLGLASVIVAGLVLGLSAPVRQVGEALILPALVYVLVMTKTWRSRLVSGTVLTACFALPILGYMTYSAVGLHDGFELSNMGDEYLYGRTAHAADCATLKIPANEWFLCPKASVAAALGVDGLVNVGITPGQTYAGSGPRLGANAYSGVLQSQFAYAVIRQQPLRVAGDIASDAVKLFALTRDGQQGDTPISRWQFQASYPYYPPGITATGDTSANVIFSLSGGGSVHVDRSLAVALRNYQLHGGFTPGPVFLLSLLAGVAGIFAYRRLGEPAMALACLLITSSAVVLLLGADLYEFSWRYQLPAIVTLPVAGALGVTALTKLYRRHRVSEPASDGPATENTATQDAEAETVL
jgi:Dolichyl-phosphate-mannose-protein mannosyltransferase